MKPGFATTEFYMALTVVVLGAAASMFAESEVAQMGGQIAAALAAAGYGFSRAGSKKAEADIRSAMHYETSAYKDGEAAGRKKAAEDVQKGMEALEKS